MADGTTRRSFLQRLAVGAAAVTAAASGLSPLVSSRADLLNQLVQHLIKFGYQIVRYSKF